jgi:hypothetical protein
MYVLPKGLESLWVVARGHGLVWHTGNWGEGALACVSMAIVMVRRLTGRPPFLRDELMHLMFTDYLSEPPTAFVGARPEILVSNYRPQLVHLVRTLVIFVRKIVQINLRTAPKVYNPILSRLSSRKFYQQSHLLQCRVPLG